MSVPDLVIYVQVIERPRLERRRHVLWRVCLRLQRLFRGER